MRFLHISPTYYSADSVIGGGEKYVLYMCRAGATAGRILNIPVENTLIAFGDIPGCYELEPDIRLYIVRGTPWQAETIDVQGLMHSIDQVDVVIVHQCLTATGLFVGAHVKLRGKFLIGLDHGGGEHQLVHRSPEIGCLFDACVAQSDFAASSFSDLQTPVHVLKGPIDSFYYQPDPTVPREPGLMASVGRILPHKGFEKVIPFLPSGTRLIIAGSTYDREYQNYLQGLPGFSRVQIVSGMSDDSIRNLFRRASLYLHPSTHFDYRGRYHPKPELLGLAPLEALSCGTRTLVSTAGSLPELAAIRGCETFSGEGDFRSMVEKLLNLPAEITPQVTHTDTCEIYGLECYGRQLFHLLEEHGALQ